MINPIVVVGAAKSGTSMTAGICRILGVNFGSQADLGEWNNHSEDLNLFDAISKKNSGLYQIFAQSRTKDGQKWGVKHPNFLKDSSCLSFMMRFGFPKFIIVQRDPIAITRSRLRDFKKDQSVIPSRFMRESVEVSSHYSDCLRWFVVNEGRINLETNVLLLSYEKCLLDPKAELVDRIVDFCSLSPSQEQMDNAMLYVQPESGYRPIQDFLSD